MKENMQIVFGLLGGLAVFIYGMNLMSESLQKAAGEKMKSILALLTKNRIMGVIAGALVTAVLQSSSATTVMAIGFVSAGLMSLPQAISIIFGANIGTTMTAQIIAFKITDYIYAFIFIGFILTFVCKSERIKSIGQTIFAFGLLFLGIETMGDVMKPLASSPVFTDLIGKVSGIPVVHRTTQKQWHETDEDQSFQHQSRENQCSPADSAEKQRIRQRFPHCPGHRKPGVRRPYLHRRPRPYGIGCICLYRPGHHAEQSHHSS